MMAWQVNLSMRCRGLGLLAVFMGMNDIAQGARWGLWSDQPQIQGEHELLWVDLITAPEIALARFYARNFTHPPRTPTFVLSPLALFWNVSLDLGWTSQALQKFACYFTEAIVPIPLRSAHPWVSSILWPDEIDIFYHSGQAPRIRAYPHLDRKLISARST